MIGGTDVIMERKPGVPAADMILRVVRRHWPDCLYQNADDEGPARPLPAEGTPPGLAPEFFLHRDEESVRSWDEFGATPDNVNTMLYVLIPGDDGGDAAAPSSVTVVCGELDGVMSALMAEIESELSCGTAAK